MNPTGVNPNLGDPTRYYVLLLANETLSLLSSTCKAFSFPSRREIAVGLDRPYPPGGHSQGKLIKETSLSSLLDILLGMSTFRKSLKTEVGTRRSESNAYGVWLGNDSESERAAAHKTERSSIIKELEAGTCRTNQ